jgi:hypothetical protein
MAGLDGANTGTHVLLIVAGVRLIDPGTSDGFLYF